MPLNREEKKRALAIDLGSTNFKLAALDAGGRLSGIVAVPAPRMRGDGLIREIDAAHFDACLEPLWKALPDNAADGPLGLVCQRSTFVIWDRTSGHALTPVVSWQDRRAADWCGRHSGADALLRARAGLLLSPHYAGPKLATMLAADSGLADRMHAGDALFGNLDAWLAWRWSGGAVHRTDLTMAARTAMVDIDTGAWSNELLDLFGVPRMALPEIVATDARPVDLTNGLNLTASIADQASGALVALDPTGDSILVNLGTGGFVLRSVPDAAIRVPGYLTAPILASQRHGDRYVLEGTINGAGPAVDAFGSGPTLVPKSDPCPGGFAIPDMDGIGAPHWRADFGLTLSPAAEALARAGDRRRVVVEGLLFRIAEILADIGQGSRAGNVYLSGGLARAPSIAPSLAVLLGRPVQVLDEPESTLLGVARLALGLEPFAAPETARVEPSEAGAYLPEKFERWKAWMRSVLDAR